MCLKNPTEVVRLPNQAPNMLPVKVIQVKVAREESPFSMPTIRLIKLLNNAKVQQQTSDVGWKRTMQ